MTTLFQEVLSGSQTGLLIRALAEQFRLELGFPFDITTGDYSLCSAYTTPTWYRSLWKFVSSHPSLVIHEDFVDPPTLRHQDTYLMNCFIQYGFKGRELRLLNELRMSIQAITVSDIATADGRSIRHSAWLLQSSNGLRSHFDWPRAIPITASLKQLWHKALRRCFLDLPNHPTSRQLKCHLWVGAWTSLTAVSYTHLTLPTILLV